MNELVNDLYNKIDNQDKIINKQVLEIASLKERIDKAREYNEHLIRDAKYHLNLGHLKKMKKILLGDEENE